MCDWPRPRMPATPTRIVSLAPITRPEAFVPAMVNSGNAALAAALDLMKLRRVNLAMAGAPFERDGRYRVGLDCNASPYGKPVIAGTRQWSLPPLVYRRGTPQPQAFPIMEATGEIAVCWLSISLPCMREVAMIANPGLRVGVWGVLAAMATMGSARSAAVETVNVLGKPAPEFRLSDFAGKEHGLADFNDARLVVVVFLGTECPLSKLYGPRLKQLAAEYAGRGVQFLGIDSNLQDTSVEIAAYASEYGISFPVLKDPQNKVADQFAAVRTPEAFLLDQQRVIRYHGRIDDQFGVGVRKTQPGRRDLAIAIDELLDGKAVSGAEQPAVGCFIGRVPEPAAGEVTYSREIARIFQKHCIECHRKGEIAPFALTTFDEALGWGETIREVVQQGRMPPWFADPKHGKFLNDPRLSDEEKQQIARWVDGGCPRGDANDLPEPVKFADGWNIPEPDLVLKMSKRPFVVPAEGVVEYQHFAINPGFSEDKWVAASEARPGNRSVVHHILVFLKPPGGQYELLRGSLLAAYAPGAAGARCPRAAPKDWPSAFRPAPRSSCRSTTRPTAKWKRTRARSGWYSAMPKT